MYQYPAPAWLYAPGDPDDLGPQFDGLALSNLSPNGSNVRLDAHSATPAWSANASLFSLASKVETTSLSLGGGTQLARVRSQLFSGNPRDPAWVEFRSDGLVGSFFQFGTSDLSQLDGGVAVEKPSRRLIFRRIHDGPTAFRGRSAFTRLSLFNPFGRIASVRLTLFQPTTQSVAVLREIPPHGLLEEKASQIFGTQIPSGYVLVDVLEGRGVVGFQRIQLAETQTVFGLNAATESDEEQLFSAQLASVPGILYTSINLVNSVGVTRNLELTAVDAEGGQLANAQISLGPGQSITRDASEIFGFDQPASVLRGGGSAPAVVASLRVQSDGEGVTGDVVFGDPSALDSAAALPLQTRLFLEAVFSQVANGLAFYNPGSETAQIRIQVFCPEGDLKAEETFSLPAGHRFSQLVSELLSETAGQVGGYTRVISSHPIVGQKLFGTLTRSLVSAVPPKVVF